MQKTANGNNKLKVLCLEDSPQDVEIIRELLVDAGYDLNMDCTAVEKEFASMLRSHMYDIILADFKLPGFDAFAALRWTMEICPNVPFICVSGSIGEETAVEILKQGAVDYVLKDRLAKLPSAIKRALGEAKGKEARRRVEETLQKSEKRLREAQEMAHLGFWNWDVKTGKVEWSEEVFKIFCLDPKKFTPHIDSILALSPWPEDHRRDQELIKKAIETHSPGFYEQKFLRPDQSIGYYYSTFQGNYDEKGDLISIVGTVLDITERKWAEDALRASEKRLHELNVLQEILLHQNPIEQKLQFVTESIVQIVGADFARIWMIKPGDRCETGCIHAQVVDGPHICRFRDRCLHLLASSGRYTHTDGKDHGRVPFDCYKIGKIAAGEEPKFLTNEVTTDPRVHNHAWAKELGLVSFAGYRLVNTDGATLGVLALFSKQAISAEDDLHLQGIAHATSQVLHLASAEEALRESEIKFRQTFDISPVGIVMVGLDKNFLHCNNAFSHSLGYLTEELVGKTIEDVTLREDRHIGMDEMMAIIKGELDISHVQKRYKRKDGQVVWGEVTITLVRDSERRPQYFLAIIQDITERKQAEEAIRLSEQQLKSYIDNAGDAIYVLDIATGRIRNCNVRACHDLGYSRDELLKLSATDIEAILPSGEVTAIHHQLKLGEVRTIDGAHKRKDGTIFPVEIRLSSMAPVQPELMVAMARDITDRKHSEGKILHQLEELKRWQEVTLGREDRNRQLKREVNELLIRLGETIRYPSQESDTPQNQPNKVL
jgi:PAS domain S-box-containing protein